MNDLRSLTAIVEHFKFDWRSDRHTVAFSSLILTTPLTEEEKRQLIFAGIEEIDNLPPEEKDCGECSNLLSGCIEEMLAQTVWHEPRHPVFIYVHQEMCLERLCGYINHIHRKINFSWRIACGIIEVPRTLFQGLERLLIIRSRIPPLAALRN